MSRSFLWILLILSAASCRSIMVEDPVNFYGRSMLYFDDSLNYYKRLVFTRAPCDSIHPKDSSGKPLELRRPGLVKNCYSCSDMESEHNVVMMDKVPYKDKFVPFFTYFPEAKIIIFTENCNKLVKGFRDGWSDSLSVAIWHRADTARGLLVFYVAEESDTFPYYKAGRMDSIIINLEKICTQKEIDEQSKMWLEALDPLMSVQITPNPFTQDFELVLTHEGTIFFQTDPIILTFSDDMGNKLVSQEIEPEKKYSFSFPDVLPGKTIYYNITWGEYKKGGQILKAR